MDVPLRKVTAKVDLRAPGGTKSRPASPTKNSPTSNSSSSFRPTAKVNSNATVRKLSSSSSLFTSRTRNGPPSRSGPGSPSKPPQVLPNESEPCSLARARITARPTSRSGMSPVQLISNSLEPRQRALTTASNAKLKLPHLEDRPRSGSVIALHHMLSLSDIKPSSSPTLPQPSPPADPLVDTRRTNTPPALAPIKIKSRVTDLAKASSASPGDVASRSLSPPYATTRPIHTRARAPSITSSFSLNDPPPSVFYPITTASPAANPHRYAPGRAHSPVSVRSHSSPTIPSEVQPTRKIVIVSKVDPTSVPLPPHSPPISALSLSSKSSVSRSSVSLNTDQTTDNQMSSTVSHIKHHSMERFGQPNLFFPQAGIKTLPSRDRSHSSEKNPCDLADRDESDSESDGSERQLKAEAKTNRKIADLEITNRSLLAINASLETTKNRQAKEIRDLRRKLRESRLILPPREYMAVKSALGNDKDDEDECDDESDAEGDGDETFQRVSSLIDGLIVSGRKALETRPEDFRASLATKVLNADELRSWRDSGQRTSMGTNYTDGRDVDDKTTQDPLSPALVAMTDSDSTSSDGEPVSDSQGPLALPPITITHSL